MSVDVAAGLALLEVTTTLLATNYTFKTWLESTATENVVISTADATNPRKDRIVAKFDMTTDPNGTSGNIVSIEVVTGTPAGSPSAPATPSNAISLAIVDVAAAASSIVDANITDDRSYAQLQSTVLLDVARKSSTDSDTEDLQDDSPTWLGTITGTDTLSGTASPTRTAYAAGQRFAFIVSNDNTSSVTINIDSLGAKSLKDGEGNNLVAADLKAGGIVECRYDGTQFLISSQKHSSISQAVTTLLRTTTDSSDVTSGTYASFDQDFDIPADSLSVGEVIDVFATAEPTGDVVGDIKMRLDGTDVLEKTNFSLSNDPVFRWTGTVRAIGASGNIEWAGTLLANNAAVVTNSGNETVDTTAAITIDFQGAKDSGSGSGLHLTQFVVRKFKA